MNVLVVEPAGPTGRAVIARLVSEGDDVGVILPEPDEAWRELGAYVAVGAADDPDLVERAAQNVRSIVLFDPGADELEAAVQGARMANDPPARLVICATTLEAPRHDRLQSSGVEFVELLFAGRRRGILRRGVTGPSPEDIASAVSAADDLAGVVKASMDLSTPEGWAALGLSYAGAPR